MSTKIGNLSEIQPLAVTQEKLSEGVLGFIGQFKVLRLLKPLSGFKTQGISLSVILSALILSRFKGLSHYAMCRLGQQLIDENTLYRMMNHPMMNWRSLFRGFALQFLRITRLHGDASTGPNCFILDDTMIPKTGATIEGISKVFDHVTKAYHLGFKLLVLALYDGKSLLPIDFSMHRGSQKKNYGLTAKQTKKQFGKKRPLNSPGEVRKEELDSKKTGLALDMLKRAFKHGITASYVLMDSWFTCDVLIQGIRKLRKGSVHVIGMCKMDNRRFSTDDGRHLKSAAMITANQSRKHKSRKYQSEYIRVDAMYMGTPVRLYYIRYHRANDWKLLLTTDVTLSFVRVMELYQIRWSIEVMFKECKQYLRLGSGQNTDFDGQVADTALTLITHIILSLQLRFGKYETMGGLFRHTQMQLIEKTLYQRIMQTILQIIDQLLEIICIDIDQTISDLICDDGRNEQVINLLNAVNQLRAINAGSKMVA